MSHDPQHGTTTSADGTTIAWTLRGSGPVLVLVEPVMMHRGLTAFADLAPALAEQATVVTYDRRGKGESGDAEAYEPDREVEDLAALVAEHGGSARLYGFSSGATLALLAARDVAGVTGVVALEPVLADDGPDVRDEIRALVREGRRGDAVRTFNRRIGIPEEVVAQIPTGPGEPTAHTLPYDLTLTGRTRAADLAAITCPTLVLASSGSDDRLRGWAREVAQAVPGAQHRELPGSWHGVDGDALVAAIRET